MAVLLSHYRPNGTIFAFTDEKRVQQKLALYQGVCPIYMKFSDDAEATFANALTVLKVSSTSRISIIILLSYLIRCLDVCFGKVAISCVVFGSQDSAFDYPSVWD
nr:plastidial pyruvate kinase 2 [Tanacetum cinerariifolium]